MRHALHMQLSHLLRQPRYFNTQLALRSVHMMHALRLSRLKLSTSKLDGTLQSQLLTS